MNKLIIPGLILAFAFSMPVSHAGDVSAGGKAFAGKGCNACHGKTGKEPIAPNYPVIGGQSADFLAGELNKFRSGERKEPTMNAMAGMLSDADIANIAAFLATQ